MRTETQSTKNGYQHARLLLQGIERGGSPFALGQLANSDSDAIPTGDHAIAFWQYITKAAVAGIKTAQ
jgi:hypothetical protein